MINDVIVERVISPVCNTPLPAAPCHAILHARNLPLSSSFSSFCFSFSSGWNSTEAETKSGFLQDVAYPTSEIIIRIIWYIIDVMLDVVGELGWKLSHPLRGKNLFEISKYLFFFLFIYIGGEEMEKIFLRANFSSDTKFGRQVYLFFSFPPFFLSLSLFRWKKCFQRDFPFLKLLRVFSNFLPLVFPSISTSPFFLSLFLLLPSLILFPFFPRSNIGPCVG